VRSLYVVRVGRHGALVRIPRAFLERLGVRKGQKLRVWTEGHRLVLEVSGT
jgi:antitoxin component of MazEF toxin-antitoxin module